MENEARIIELLEEISAKLDKVAETVEDTGASIEGAIMLAGSPGQDDLGTELT